MKTLKKTIVFMLALLTLCSVPSGVRFGGTVDVSAASKADKVIKAARNSYYSTEKNLKKYKKVKSSTSCTDYYDNKNKLRLTVVKANINDPLSMKNITCEYYYNSKQKLVFAFAYKKSVRKVKEYRAYYSASDGKCYRYIGPNKKVKTYEKGKYGNMPKMAWELRSKGNLNLHYLGINY